MEWDDRFANLLEVAEESGIARGNECQQGDCSTCKVKLLSGEVDMDVTDGLDG